MMSTVYEIEAKFESANRQFSALKEYIGQAAGKVKMHTAEQDIFNQLLQIGLSLLHDFVQRSSEFTKEQPLPSGPDDCALTCKGTGTRSYLSIFGELKIKRTRYRNRSGGYYQPLDAQLNLPTDKHSYLLQKWLQAGASETDYREAAQYLNEIFGFSFLPNTLCRIAGRVSDEVAPFYAEKAAPSAESEGPCLAISADGKGVRIIQADRNPDGKNETEPPKPRLGRGEKPGKKKEAIVTTDFSFFPAAREPEEIVKALMNQFSEADRDLAALDRQLRREYGEPEPRAALNKHIRAFFDGKTAAMDYLVGNIQKRNPDGQKPIIVLIDGDPGLERSINRALAKHGLAGRVDAFLLDIIHVTEYLWKAATALYGERGQARIDWVEAKLRMLLNSQVDTVIKSLKITLAKQKKISQEKRKRICAAITYFTNHRHMMHYKTALEKGYPIATGLVESACCSLVKERMEHSGMRWSIKGAKSILEIRAIKKNGDWEQFWRTFILSQAKKHYPDNYSNQKERSAA